MTGTRRRLLSFAAATAAACAGDGAPRAPDASVEPDAFAGLVLSAVSPASGPLEGGTEVAITGRGFRAGARVRFGAAEAADVIVAGATRIDARTPAADGPGCVAVRVDLPDGRFDEIEAPAEGEPCGSFEYVDAGAVSGAVEWCDLRHPPALTVRPGVESEPIFGRVFARGLTPGEGPGGPLLAELGWGLPGNDPLADWTWVAAAYNADADGLAPGDLANDEYRAAFTVPAGQEGERGTLGYAYRFSGDEGDTWLLCDLDGSDNGYAPEQAGVATIDFGTPRVGWCNLQHPPATSARAGEPTEPIYGRVWVQNVTPGPGRGDGVLAQAGFGPDGADPDAGAFTWADADYNVDADGLAPGDLANDEYQAVMAPPKAGRLDYAYRFSIDGGATWTACDLGGSDDGYSPDAAGDLTVTAK